MKITAVCAGVGLAVGAALFGVLRYVAGQRVLDGLGARASVGSTRGFTDYLPTDSAVPLGSLRLLPVALGSGLVAGLLVGVLLQVLRSRRASGVGRPLLVAVLAGSGLVVGALLAVELHTYGHHPSADAAFGLYSYSPITNATVGADGIFYGGGPGTGPWWPLLITGAVVGLVVGVLAAGAVLVAGRRPGGRVRRA